MKHVLGLVFLLAAVPSLAEPVRVFIKDNAENPLPITFQKIECFEEQARRVRVFLGRGESQRERMEIVVPFDADGVFSQSNEVCLKVYDPRLDERTFCTSAENDARCNVQAKRLDGGRLQISLDCSKLARTISSASRLSFTIKDSEPLVCPVLAD